MRIRRVLLAALLLIATSAASLTAQGLTIRFLDVGQGDAALIQTPEGKTVLIDAGRPGSSVGGFLAANRIDTLDLVVASHNHDDHIGGMSPVVSSFFVRNYLENGIPQATATYRRTVRALSERQVRVLRAEARVITLGSARVRVLSLPPTEENQEQQNNWSVGLLVEYGTFRALFTGDSEQDELKYWLEHDSIPPVQVLNVAHHGSWNGTTEEWAEATRPLVAVISVGARNAYGHPGGRVVELWSDVAARVYRTDRDGGVTVEADSTGRFVVTTDAELGCPVTYPIMEASRVLCR